MVWQKNVELLAYNDLRGKSSFKLALQEVEGRFILYVGALWHSGWSILDVTDPSRPDYLRFVDGPPNTWTIQVQVADQKLITALEHIPAAWTTGESSAEPSDGFIVWDVSDPERPDYEGLWTTGAIGTHRNVYNGGEVCACHHHDARLRRLRLRRR
jgi:hypothetical protein